MSLKQRKPMNRGQGFKSAITDATHQALAAERQTRRSVQVAALLAMKDLPGRPRGVIAPASNDIVAVPKEILIDCKPYRMYVASQECFLCRIVGFSQCAHENFGKGLQIKVCDSKTFPACVPHHGLAGCHYLFDNYIDIGRDEARELGAKLSAQMRERATAAGWTFTGTAILAHGAAA